MCFFDDCEYGHFDTWDQPNFDQREAAIWRVEVTESAQVTQTLIDHSFIASGFIALAYRLEGSGKNVHHFD